MLTRLKLKRGEVHLVSAQRNPQPRRVREPPPRAIEAASRMSSREGEAPEDMDPKEEERVFRKAFLDMTEMVRILYQERNDRLVREASKNRKEGEGSSRGKKSEEKTKKGHGGNGDPPSPSSSSSSTSSSSISVNQSHKSKTTSKIHF